MDQTSQVHVLHPGLVMESALLQLASVYLPLQFHRVCGPSLRPIPLGACSFPWCVPNISSSSGILGSPLLLGDPLTLHAMASCCLCTESNSAKHWPEQLFWHFGASLHGTVALFCFLHACKSSVLWAMPGSAASFRWRQQYPLHSNWDGLCVSLPPSKRKQLS